jgi:hypothetical protein
VTTRKLGLKITKVFGKGLPLNVIANSILFALVSFFYILSVGSYFKPLVYPLIDRVTYSTQFINKYIFGNYYDPIIISFGLTLWFLVSINGKLRFILSFIYGVSTVIAITGNISIIFNILFLFSLPIIIIFIIINKIMKNKILFFNKQICINYLAILGILIGIISIFTTLSRIIIPQLSLPSVNYLYYIFLLFSILTPILLIIISTFFPFKLLISKFLRLKKFSKCKDESSNSTPLYLPQSLNMRTRIIYFLLIVTLSIAITFIPHIQTINKDNQVIGDDSKAYANILKDINNASNLQEILKQVFIKQMAGDRPLSLISFFLWSHIVDPNNITNSIEYLPLVLGPLLILSIYFLTLEITTNHFTALLASFLTITSFHILVGTYAGLYSNWFSLIFGYLAFLFLFRSFKKPTKLNIITFSILMVVTLLSHVPTWTILTLVIIISLAIMLKIKKYPKISIFYLFIAIIPSLVTDGLRMILTKSSGVVEDASFAHSQGAGIHDIATFWYNLVSTTQIYMAGLFGNSIILILVLYWLYKCNIKDKSTLLIIVFFSLTIIPIIFGEKQIQTRFLFEIPFQIPVAIALTYIRKNQGIVFFSVICLWLVIISIRAATNFYFIQQ